MNVRRLVHQLIRQILIEGLHFLYGALMDPDLVMGLFSVEGFNVYLFCQSNIFRFQWLQLVL
jgi:hypothetical protein